MLVLSRADIFSLLDWNEAVQAVGEAFVALSTGRARVPLRLGLDLPAQEGLLLLMPGALHIRQAAPPTSQPDGTDLLAVKQVSVFNRNPAQNLPLIYGLVTLLEANTGCPLAVMEGASVTAIRTGAASGVATEQMATRETTSLALFGTGAQAYTQLRAIAAVRAGSLREVRVVGRDQERTRQFAEQMTGELGLPVWPAHSVAQALAEARIVATATTSPVPVFEDYQLAPGTHINGVGSYQPTTHEVPSETVARARLVVDSRESAMQEAGDLLIPMQEGRFGPAHIYAELGEIVAGLKPGRSSFEPDEISFFKSVGNAAQDVALAHYLYQKALHLGRGTQVEL